MDLDGVVGDLPDEVGAPVPLLAGRIEPVEGALQRGVGRGVSSGSHAPHKKRARAGSAGGALGQRGLSDPGLAGDQHDTSLAVTGLCQGLFQRRYGCIALESLHRSPACPSYGDVVLAANLTAG